ncbi:hypothetical protein LWI29_022044 [Acer saccharum]|uniref:Uncharacterized protein n=1 Tax=Acer saccharum TaxID=4024 RepID=A0AA39SLK7_ACESA|nr:hypothetical protein LWI29_022044 [Acer saccharum]
MDQDPKPYPHMNSGILTTVPNVPLVREREQNGGDFEGGQIVNSKEDDCDDNGRVNKVDNTNSTSMVSKKKKGGDEEGAFNRDKWYLEVEVAKVIKEGNAHGIFAKSRNKIGGDRPLPDTVDGNSCLDIEITKLLKNQIKSQENILCCLSESVARTSLLALVSASLFFVDPVLAYKGGGPYGSEKYKGTRSHREGL